MPFLPRSALPDALAAYRHFLGASGRTRRLDLERHVADGQSGRTFLRNAIVEGRLAAHDLHRRHFAKSPTEGSRFTGTALSAGGGSARFPYPATGNWQKAIGAFRFWLSGDVEVEPPAAGSAPRFTFELTVHVEDMYNFNPGAADIATGIPDDANGVFEITGLAGQHLDVGAIERTVAWIRAPSGTSPGVEGAPSIRPRRPQDNRRPRDRVCPVTGWVATLLLVATRAAGLGWTASQWRDSGSAGEVAMHVDVEMLDRFIELPVRSEAASFEM